MPLHLQARVPRRRVDDGSRQGVLVLSTMQGVEKVVEHRTANLEEPLLREHDRFDLPSQFQVSIVFPILQNIYHLENKFTCEKWSSIHLYLRLEG